MKDQDNLIKRVEKLEDFLEDQERGRKFVASVYRNILHNPYSGLTPKEVILVAEARIRNRKKDI